MDSEEGERKLIEANRLLGQRKYEEAKEVYDELLSGASGGLYIQVLKGKICAYLMEHEEGIRNYDEVEPLLEEYGQLIDADVYDMMEIAGIYLRYNDVQKAQLWLDKSREWLEKKKDKVGSEEYEYFMTGIGEMETHCVSNENSKN